MDSTTLVQRFLDGHSLRMLADEMHSDADSAERHLRAALIEIAESAATPPADCEASPTPRKAQAKGADSSPRPPRTLIPTALLACNRAPHRMVYESLSEGEKSMDKLISDCMMSLPDLDACVRWLSQHGYIWKDAARRTWSIRQEVSA